jgi:cholesterol oxidase
VSKVMNRRQFIQTSLTTTAAFSVARARAYSLEGEQYIEAVVIGSGFGGAVASLRLGEAGMETVVLERGKRWPITAAGDTFCTKEKPDGRAAWLSSTTILPDPLPKLPIDVFTGVLDRKIGNGVIAYRGAGVGGGSLMYGGITYQPAKELFYRVFPSTLSYDELDRVYYPGCGKGHRIGISCTTPWGERESEGFQRHSLPGFHHPKEGRGGSAATRST